MEVTFLIGSYIVSIQDITIFTVIKKHRHRAEKVKTRSEEMKFSNTRIEIIKITIGTIILTVCNIISLL